MYEVGRHHTGTYHLTIGPSAAVCSSSGLQSRPLHLRGVSADELVAADDKRFCKRCFRDAVAIATWKARAVGASA